ncbi:MAG: peptidoglycan endopeptidase [Solirubrobacterales bacterium]
MRRQGMLFTAAAALLLVCATLAVPSAAVAAVPQARLLPDGHAVAPPDAPPAVKSMIEAANRIRHRPYVWGGGHRGWNSRGYDCSGSVSYVMHAAGLLEWPLDSTGFMRWGGGGAGSWVRIYANREHVFAIIAGLRWDTSFSEDGDRSGPGWSEQLRRTGGFRLRHPLGLFRATPLA